MGARRRSTRSWRSGLAKLLAGGGLISVGVCLGVVLGSVLDGPRLFVRRLTQGVQQVEIQRSPGDLESESLMAFRELQRARPAPPPARRPSPTVATEPAPRQTAAAKPPASVAAAPGPGPAMHADSAAKPEPTVAKVKASAAKPEPRLGEAERVISEIARREASRQQARPGKVVQVAAYTERGVAEALVARLRDDGFGAYVSDTRPEGSTHRYRVRVRTQKGQSPQALASTLEERGLSVWITTE